MQYVNYILPIIMFNLKLKHKGYGKTAWLNHLREKPLSLSIFILVSINEETESCIYVIFQLKLFLLYCSRDVYNTSWKERLLHLNMLYITIFYYVCNGSYIVVHCAWKTYYYMYWESPLSKAKAEEPGTVLSRARIFLSSLCPEWF